MKLEMNLCPWAEIKFIEDYIYLHRKDLKILYFLEYVEELLANKSAFACFIHFVENIFKHGMINNEPFQQKLKYKLQAWSDYWNVK
jgi:hypothetical protein